MEIYGEIVALVATTGIGAGVYAWLEIVKPWLKGFYNIPRIKLLCFWITNKFGIDSSKAYDALIKLIVFIAAYVVAWQMGANGDLLVLMERTTETSYLGYGLTAAIIASGDLAVNGAVDAFKANNNNV